MFVPLVNAVNVTTSLLLVSLVLLLPVNTQNAQPETALALGNVYVVKILPINVFLLVNVLVVLLMLLVLLNLSVLVMEKV